MRMAKATRVIEGAAVVAVERPSIVSRKMEVFYNPQMRHNRDVTLLLFSALATGPAALRDLQGCDLLAGTGVRSIRLLRELPGLFSHLTINDSSPEAARRIVENLAANGIPSESWSRDRYLAESVKRDGPGAKKGEQRGKRKATLPPVLATGLDANLLLLASNGFDYIDIDPFGSPNDFLDLACRRISRHGILAVTATDTSVLAGSYPDACRRKYWADPIEGERKHEVGLRILVRKCQLVAAQHDKALTPLLVYNKDHYYRAIFSVEKGKRKADALLALHGHWAQEPKAGPLWTGRLADPAFVDRMLAVLPEEEASGGKTIGKSAAELPRGSSRAVKVIVEDVPGMRHFLETLREENALLDEAAPESERIPYYFTINEVNRERKAAWKKTDLLELLGEYGAPSHHDSSAVRSTRGLLTSHKACP